MPFASLGGPVRGTSNKTVVAKGRFTGGGAAANMVKVTGCAKGITSVVYTATGKYTVTFDAVGKNFLGCTFSVTNSPGTVAATYVAVPIAYSATNKTITIAITDLTTPVLKDLAGTDELWIDAAWADSDSP